MRMIPTAATALLALLLSACATSRHDSSSAAADPAPVLLVSLDGFHPRYLGQGRTPTLDALADGGVRAEWMTPSYPSLTFPNHYTLVTGLRPDRHGVVHNTMWDEALGGFKLSDREAVGESRWWGGEPLWVTAERAGLPTATLSWPGSEAAVAGVRPTRWHAFDDTRPIDTRVDMVLGWLKEPAATRPRLATLYFEHLDHAAHSHGPDSPEALAEVARLDAALGRLMDGLRDAGLDDAVNIVVTSDHGMATVRPGQVGIVEDMVDEADARLVTTGQSVGFTPLPGRTAQAEAQLLGRHDHYECWRKGELPARWHYGTHPRVPAIVCQMDEGWDAIKRDWAGNRPSHARGSHGFDPALPSMRALFIAHGPAFRPGTVLPPIDNVDVYPLLARLMGVPAAPHDGDAQALLPALSATSP